MEELKNCPICNHSSFSHFLNCIDYTVSRKTFNIVSCEYCGFKFTNSRPEKEAIGKYYESEDYISHSNSKKGLFNIIYQAVRKYTIRKKVKLISNISRKKKEGKSILDIGCGTGEFLNACKNKGWRTLGIEPGKQARKYAISHYGIEVKEESALTSLEDQTFDVITLWHVLEHVHELNERMRELRRLVKPEGKLIIAVPNYLSYDAAHYGTYWAAYDVPRHLYHFSPNTMTQLLGNYGIQIQKMLPMKFDSFYVSLLSEKYKSGKTNFLKAFVIGLKSSKLSQKAVKKSSSIIYICSTG